jgi:glutamate 5-kinase
LPGTWRHGSARGAWSSPARRRACSTRRRDDAGHGRDDVARLVGDGTATAGMIAKLRACEQALAAGVDDVVIVDGRKAETLSAAAASERRPSATRLVANAGARQPEGLRYDD